MSRPSLIASLLVALASLFPALKARGADTDSVATVRVFFKQSHATLLPDFDGNGARIDSLLRALDGADISAITVTGAASPEGSAAFNESLSRRRARAIFDYVETLYSLPDSLTRFRWLGRDWRGLYAQVEADSMVPARDEVLTLLERGGVLTPGEPAGDGTRLLSLLKALDGGRPYAYLYSRLFPRLRFSSLSVDFMKPYRMPPIAVDPLAPLGFADIVAGFSAEGLPSIPAPSPRAHKPFYMAVKTNMLFDLLAVPQLGVEFYVGKNFSVVANWNYGWWDTDSRHRYWRAYGGDLAVRWWFGSAARRKPLTGHHIGIYGGVETFDFEFGGRGVMGGIPRHTLWDRCMGLGGIEYGYSLPIGRRLNIDFTIGLGYMGGKYLKYEPCPGGYRWLSTHRLNWVGPTKAEISLVWLIGRGNVNQ